MYRGTILEGSGNKRAISELDDTRTFRPYLKLTQNPLFQTPSFAQLPMRNPTTLTRFERIESHLSIRKTDVRADIRAAYAIAMPTFWSVCEKLEIDIE